jgi:multidrug resistance efflux pump
MDEAETKKSSRPSATQSKADENPVRRWTLIVLAICAVLFIYHLFSDRLTPFTSQATVQAFVVDIAPQVAGPVSEVFVEDNHAVKNGEALFRVDPTRFEIAVKRAEAALASAGQNIGASTAQVAAAEARLAEAQAKQNNVREQSARIFELVLRGVYPPARRDEAENALKAAQAAVDQANAALDEANQRLGPAGADNPQFRSALADLQKARLDLIQTTVLAPSDGLITNLKLSVGRYLQVGVPAMTFIDIRAVWILAEMRENNLGRIKTGDTVDIALDVRPGRIFKGVVDSVGWGVATTGPGASSLPTTGNLLNGSNVQRFQVRILFKDTRPPKGVRVGSQATVVAYSGGSIIMNTLAWIRIRANSLLSYVY